MKRPSLASVPDDTPARDTTGVPARTGLKPRSAFWRDRGGATSLDYALLAGFVAVPLALAAPGFGAAVEGLFGAASQSLSQSLQHGTGSCEASRVTLDRAARVPGQP